MNTQMEELRAMMRQLLNGNKPPAAPCLEANASATQSGEGEQQTNESPPKIDGGNKPEYHGVPFTYSVDPPIPHYHINNRGDPPKFNPSCFTNWQFMMKSHIKSASSELWRIIQVGFKAVDPNNMTRREVVDGQLNDLALNIIHTAVGEKHMSLIEMATTAKEAWDILTQEFVGNESMQRNRYLQILNQYLLSYDFPKNLIRSAPFFYRSVLPANCPVVPVSRYFRRYFRATSGIRQ